LKTELKIPNNLNFIPVASWQCPINQFSGDQSETFQYCVFFPCLGKIYLLFRFTLHGTYGNPATHFTEAGHAVLISSGIGVTPFASILQGVGGGGGGGGGVNRGTQIRRSAQI
jgi:hypothetical protein